MKKFLICKTCLNVFATLLLVGCGETIKTAVKKSDEFIYENADKVARKDDVTGRREINLTSVEEELKLGKQAFDQIVAQYEGKVLPKDDPRYIRVENIFKRVIAASHFRDADTPELAVIDDPMWNAYATTGGRTIFFTGLVDSSTDDEIAVVMGHELAHSSLSHITETQWQSRVKKAFNRKGVQQGFAESFSAIHEREADEIGLLYSTLAGYDPNAGRDLWAKKAASRQVAYRYFSTHPADAERANANAVTASKVSEYLVSGQVNPDVETLLVCNNIYCRSGEDELKGGEGGGYLALLEVAINTALKNAEAKRDRQKQEARIREQQERDAQARAEQEARELKALEGQPPQIDWHSSWKYKYQGYFQRFGAHDSGVSFALTNDASAGNYYFVKDGQIQKGEMRFVGRDKSGKWLIYDFNDPFGSGQINFQDFGSEVSGAICVAPNKEQCGGFKGARQ